MSHQKVVIDAGPPVSYTHLDVYKRQPCGVPIQVWYRCMDRNRASLRMGLMHA